MFRFINAVALSLFLSFVTIPRVQADAPQTPISGADSNYEKILRLRQDMDNLEKQAKPTRLKLQRLMSQVQGLRNALDPIEQKISADRQKIQSMLYKHP